MVRQAAIILFALLAASTAFAQKHLGVASCSSTVCHGSVTPSKSYDVLLNEYVTWSHEDAHSKAYTVLSSPRGTLNGSEARIAERRHGENLSGLPC